MTAPHHYRSQHRWLPDDELEELIANVTGAHPMLWGATITIRAQDGVVTLTGTVRTPLNRVLVELLARRQGALGVDNRLQVAGDASALGLTGDDVRD